MIPLEQTESGVLLPVQAKAGARRNAIVGEHAGRLRVAVTQAPEKGKANEAIAKLLAESLGLKRSQLELIAGETSPQKKFRVSAISLEELRTRIEQALSEAG